MTLRIAPKPVMMPHANSICHISPGQSCFLQTYFFQDLSGGLQFTVQPGYLTRQHVIHTLSSGCKPSVSRVRGQRRCHVNTALSVQPDLNVCGAVWQLTSCANCAAGAYSGQGSSACVLCTSGKFSAAGAGVCTVCDAGKYSWTGESVCRQCVPGEFSSAEASSCS